jgi:ferritin
MLVKSLLNEDMKDGLQKSIYWELYQSNLWKSLSNQLQRLGLFGSQKYFLAESAEELTHYQIIVEFMNDMGGCAELPKIEAITDKVKTIGDALEIGYEIENEVYNHYKDFAKDAMAEDLAVYNFLQQFIDIQVKAVGAYGDLLAKYKVAEETKEILFFDKSMGKL